MKNTSQLWRNLKILSAVLLASSLCVSRGFAQATGPTVTTDQPDYPPGGIVYITGAGFAPNEIVSVRVLHVGDGDTDTSPAHQPWDVTADGDGNIATTWLVPFDEDELGATLLLTATGQSSDLTAQNTFTDGNVK